MGLVFLNYAYFPVYYRFSFTIVDFLYKNYGVLKLLVLHSVLYIFDYEWFSFVLQLDLHFEFMCEFDYSNWSEFSLIVYEIGIVLIINR